MNSSQSVSNPAPQNPAAQNAAPQYLELDGGRIAYRVAGDEQAPLILLIHGMGNRGETFRFLVPRLVAAGYRVATMDSRGHGQSTSGWASYAPAEVGRDGVALLRHLGGPAVVLGNSSGAASAHWIAAEAPELVSALVLEGAFFGDAELKWYLRAVVGAVTSRPALWGMYFSSLFPTQKPADHADFVRRLKRELGGAGRMDAVRGNMHGKAECMATLHQVTAPTLLVYGSKDPDFTDPVAEAARFEAALRGRAAEVSTLVIDGAGHYPHAEFPEQEAAGILSFLKAGARG